MKVLILGGTLFLGRHLVEAALARGHEVTLFNRGRTNPELFPEVEKLRGDRDGGDLSALRGREWDAVIDTSGYVPRVVLASAEALADSVGQYTFVSSASVYMPTAKLGVSEEDPVHELEDEASEDVETLYGPLKVACERGVERIFPARALVVRPGVVVGPHDPTGRFTHWVKQVARGGDVRAPRPPGARVQLIDAADLARWMLRMTERRLGGTFNAAGSEQTFTEMLEACRTTAGSQARPVWVDDDDLPLALDPARHPEWAGFFAVSSAKARCAGLVTRPLQESARAVLEAEGLPAVT
ncbi:MAG: NAD-dependent epimerase/dehydratase family protein [Gaiellaceae bacterium]